MSEKTVAMAVFMAAGVYILIQIFKRPGLKNPRPLPLIQYQSSEPGAAAFHSFSNPLPTTYRRGTGYQWTPERT